MRRADGFTIIQIMLVLLVVGIVVWAAVNVLIEKRCEEEPSASLCAGRSAARNK